jgi:cell wall-associated NlpC family hydrolase
MSGPARRRASRLVAAVLAPAAVLLALAGPAAATPTGPDAAELQEQVGALRSELERLEVAAEHAVEDYNAVRAEVDALAAAEVDAQVDLDDAGRRLSEDRLAATQRVRALYRAGGQTEITLTAIAGSLAVGGGPAALADQVTTFRTARTVLAADAEVVARAREQVDAAVTTSATVQDVRRQRADAETRAEQERGEAEAALREAEVLLATTDRALVDAVERERQEEEARALARAVALAEERAQEAAAAAAAAAVEAAPPAGAGTSGVPGLSGLSADARRQAELVVAGEQAGGGTAPRSTQVAPGGRLGAAEAAVVVERAAVAAPTPQAAAAIRAAGSRLGATYVWGATGPGTFDCSGLTMWAYRQAGVQIPRTSRQQYAGLPRVAVQDMLPGDLLFYASGSAPGSIHHVSMYLGDGLMITAPRTGDVVKVSALWDKPVYGAVRPVS